MIRRKATWADGLGETDPVESGVHRGDDGDATRALQRAIPPAAALAWVAAAAGARSVDSVERMPGGASLAMHRVTVTFADGGSAGWSFAATSAPTRSSKTPRSPRTKPPCCNSSNGSRHRHHG